MKGKRLPKSLRRFIRKEKARIRQEVLGSEEQKRLINEIYQGFFKEPIKKEEKVEQKTGR